MRFSEFFAPTTKNPPKDAVLKSHKFLIQGGFIEQIASGIYNFLPLGHRVMEKIKRIVNEEMQNVGAMQLNLSFVVPAHLWEKTDRLQKYKELLIFCDRKNTPFVLGPTFEESVTQLAKNHIRSYKNLNVNFYQIGLKFRDEMRPRSGLLRCREFVMKDAYSFHADERALFAEFMKMQSAYEKIFTRLGLHFRVIEADSGSIGGSGSREFVVLCEDGEDEIAVCDSCDFAANIEACEKISELLDPKHRANFAKFRTENLKTVDEIANFFEIPAAFVLKCVVMRPILSEKTDQNSVKNLKDLAFFFMRGDQDLELTKALNAYNRAARRLKIPEANGLEMAQPIDLAGLHAGYIGPYSLKNLTQSDFIFFDKNLRNQNGFVCGANENHYHFVGVDLATFQDLAYEDFVAAKNGDFCPKCAREKSFQGRLTLKNGIEIGHIFKLGDRYSVPLNAMFLDRDGAEKPFIMGCYGIGVSRLVSVILEQNSDERGCVWSKKTAPFDVQIVLLGEKTAPDPENHKKNVFAENLHDFLINEKQMDVILDDRNERFGSKMRDFELIGSHFAVIIGKDFEDGFVEIVQRNGLMKEKIPANIHEISEKILHLLSDLM